MFGQHHILLHVCILSATSSKPNPICTPHLHIRTPSARAKLNIPNIILRSYTAESVKGTFPASGMAKSNAVESFLVGPSFRIEKWDGWPNFLKTEARSAEKNEPLGEEPYGRRQR